VITSPEHCDQNVTCRSSLGQIGNELSTGANHPLPNRIATVRTTIMRRLRRPTGGPELCAAKGQESANSGGKSEHCRQPGLLAWPRRLRVSRKDAVESVLHAGMVVRPIAKLSE
jgi:hypothetical protein